MENPGSKTTAQRLLDSGEKIKEEWSRRARNETSVASGHNGGELALTPAVSPLLRLIANALRGDILENEKIDWIGHSAEQILLEHQILRQVILDNLNAEGSLTYDEIRIIQDVFDQEIRSAVVGCGQIQQFQEKLELQYLKLIEKFVVEVSVSEPMVKNLEGFLAVVREEMKAEAVVMLLYRKGTSDLALSAASGKSDTLAERYKTALAFSSFAIQVSRSTQNITLSNVNVLGPDLSSSLKKVGIHYIIGMRLRSKNQEMGSLCIGFRERKDLDPVEVQLLNILSERLATLFGDLKIYEQFLDVLKHLKHDQKNLKDEHKQREEFISALTHDLRSPLIAAKIKAELICRSAANPPETKKFASEIIGGIERTDRMIHDLLDANQIKAGKRLPLEMKFYNMHALAAEVVTEFKGIYGDRFRLVGDKKCEGWWSPDGMRRVLENLLTNAIKYGAAETPITITVKNVDSKMAMSVHNEGSVISAESQGSLFDPYQRGDKAQKSRQKGWGIGLTLVRGIIDAHGGTVKIKSSSEDGTAFTVINPMDSRPYASDQTF